MPLMRLRDLLTPNKALHRTAFCAWGFALEFFLFISQFVAVGELGHLDLLTRRTIPYVFVAAACLSLFAGCVARPICILKATPTKPEQLAGVWIGFEQDELDFVRLDLRPDFTGYLTGSKGVCLSIGRAVEAEDVRHLDHERGA